MDDRLWPRASEWIVSGTDRVADIHLVGVPSSIASISPSEARDAPTRLREALRRFSPFDGDRSIDLESILVVDHGDLPIDDRSMVRSQADVRSGVRALDLEGPVVFVGGDNAITRPIVDSRFPAGFDGVGIVTLDAHHDVRVLDHGPTNGTPIRGLVEDGFPPGNIVQIGIHSFANSSAYRSYCEDLGIGVFTAADVAVRTPEAVVDAALYRLRHVAEIYVDFDIDVLDSAFAPGCPGARPGGLTPRQLGDAAFALGREPRVVAADLVEVDPSRDRDGQTVSAMAHTLLSFVSGIATRTGAP